MLYYIIPPLVIIICLAVLASFLFKKASQIPAREFSHPEDTDRGLKKISKTAGRGLLQFILKMLERAMQRFKLLSLRSHNLSQKWFQSIKQKREKNAIQNPQELKENKGPVLKVETIQRNETKSYPMISNKIVRPEPQVEIKNRLEAALIERIATNPSDIEAYERLGDYYAEQGNQQDALECFRQVLKISPLNRKARLKLRKMEKIVRK